MISAVVELYGDGLRIVPVSLADGHGFKPKSQIWNIKFVSMPLLKGKFEIIFTFETKILDISLIIFQSLS